MVEGYGIPGLIEISPLEEEYFTSRITNILKHYSIIRGHYSRSRIWQFIYNLQRKEESSHQIVRGDSLSFKTLAETHFRPIISSEIYN